MGDRLEAPQKFPAVNFAQNFSGFAPLDACNTNKAVGVLRGKCYQLVMAASILLLLLLSIPFVLFVFDNGVKALSDRPMIATLKPDLLLSRLKNLLASDQKLFASIQEIHIYLSSDQIALEIIPTQSGVNQIEQKIAKITRFALSLAPFKIIKIMGDELTVETLIQLCPSINKPYEGSTDRAFKMEKLFKRSQCFDAAVELLRQKATVYVISTEGIYLECYPRQHSRIPVEEMIGKSLEAVLPNLSAALLILHNIKEAYQQGDRRTIEYGLWDSRYRAEIIPVEQAHATLVAVERLDK